MVPRIRVTPVARRSTGRLIYVNHISSATRIHAACALLFIPPVASVSTPAAGSEAVGMHPEFSTIAGRRHHGEKCLPCGSLACRISGEFRDGHAGHSRSNGEEVGGALDPHRDATRRRTAPILDESRRKDAVTLLSKTFGSTAKSPATASPICFRPPREGRPRT